MQTDVAIVGAGPAGLSLAACLAGSGLGVVLVERLAEPVLARPPFDGREIALNHTSQTLLKRLGAWGRLGAEEIAPIREARVLNGHMPLTLRLSPPERAGEPLGWFVPNHAIRRTLYETVAERGEARFLCGRKAVGLELGGGEARLLLDDGSRIGARLIVAADTRFSALRELAGIAADRLDFGKTMIVARVEHERPNGRVATEWYAHGYTIAMLPLGDHVASAVLTVSPAEAERLMALCDEEYGAEVTRRYEGRLGRMRLVSTRHPYPLVAVLARRFVARRFALIGDAAVGMHPTTAHGYNLGLSGAWALAERLREAASRGADPGGAGTLFAYAVAHRRASLPMYYATNAIARLYTDERAPAFLARAAVLAAGAAIAPVRRAIVAHLMARPAALAAA